MRLHDFDGMSELIKSSKKDGFKIHKKDDDIDYSVNGTTVTEAAYDYCSPHKYECDMIIFDIYHSMEHNFWIFRGEDHISGDFAGMPFDAIMLSKTGDIFLKRKKGEYDYFYRLWSLDEFDKFCMECGGGDYRENLEKFEKIEEEEDEEGNKVGLDKIGLAYELPMGVFEKEDLSKNSTMEKIIEELSKRFEKLKSVSFEEDKNGDYDAIINITRYRFDDNKVTIPQYRMLKYFSENIYGLSNNRIQKYLSKYAASVLITLSKEYSGYKFYVRL